MDFPDKVFKEAFHLNGSDWETFNFEGQRKSVLRKIENRSIRSALTLKHAVWGLSLGLAGCCLLFFLAVQTSLFPSENRTLFFKEDVEMLADIEFYENMEILEALPMEEISAGSGS